MTPAERAALPSNGPITTDAESSEELGNSQALSAHHREELEVASAIDPQVIAERGYTTVARPNAALRDAYGRDTRDQLKAMGFPSWATREEYYFPGLHVPMWTPTGRKVAGQWKPFRPVSNREGKAMRYASAKGCTGLDVHPRWTLGVEVVPPIRDAARRLWITEGVKKADSLTSQGEVTLALAGVYNWRNGHGTLGDWEDVTLKGREVTVCFDADATSKPAVARAMARLGKWLRHKGAAKVLYVVPPPAVEGTPVKGVDDYFAAGGTLPALVALRQAKPIQCDDTSDAFTDTVLAQECADEALEGAYVWAGGLGWLGWNGRVWAEVTDATIGEVIRQWVHTRYSEAVTELAAAGINGDRAAVDGWHKTLSQSRQSALFKLARGIVERKAEEFDTDPDILNTPSGIVDLATGALSSHDPNAMCTKITAGAYRPGYTHKDWDQALEALRPDAREWYQARIGQAITGHTTPDGILPILHGGGENGKSAVSTDGLLPALGGYAAPASPKLLGSVKNEHSTERADLRGQRLVILEELTEGRSIDVGALKGIADVGRIKARKVHKDNVEFVASHSLLATTNYEPVVSETDHGTWRRLALVVFPYTWLKAGVPLEAPDDRRGDEQLKDRIKTNTSGQHDAIVTWAVEGARCWYAWREACARAEAEGTPAPVSPMALPASVEADTLGWRVKADRVLGFWTECLTADPTAMVEAGELLAHFNAWLAGNGHTAWSKETFAAKFGAHRETKRTRVARKQVRTGSPGVRIVRRPGALVPADLPARPWVWASVRYRTAADEATENGG
ncbi:phage/plasmid primase, P4 family [Dactylosporangium sp. CA-139114]|uniref:phage/plasmid primase, P4 family n=1 Tax=Dactylosporangium sp. CA-139114 TaxID=3239931 RepID=UPI003D96B228